MKRLRNPQAADHHWREGDAVAFNEDIERWCGLRESSRGTLRTRLLSGYKTSVQQTQEYVGVFALLNS